MRVHTHTHTHTLAPAVICTCSHEAVLSYPAETIVEYFMSAMASPHGVRRVSEGVQFAGAKMSERVRRLKCNVSVKNLASNGDGSLVCFFLLSLSHAFV